MKKNKKILNKLKCEITKVGDNFSGNPNNAMTLSIMTLSILTLRITMKNVTLTATTTQHYDI